MSEKPDEVWPPPPTVSPPEPPKPRKMPLRFLAPLIPLLVTVGIPLHMLWQALHAPPGRDRDFQMLWGQRGLVVVAFASVILVWVNWHSWKQETKKWEL